MKKSMKKLFKKYYIYAIIIMIFTSIVMAVVALTFPSSIPSWESPSNWEIISKLNNIKTTDCWVWNYIQWFNSSWYPVCLAKSNFKNLSVWTNSSNYTLHWDWLFTKYLWKILQNCWSWKYMAWFDASKNMICKTKTWVTTNIWSSINLTSPVNVTFPGSIPAWSEVAGWAYTSIFNTILQDCWSWKYLQWYNPTSWKICNNIITWACWSADWTPTSVQPTTYLCNTWNLISLISNVANYTWTCEWDLGTNDPCSAPRQYTVTFNWNGWSGHTPTSKVVTYNTAVSTLPSNPSRTNYTFNGWFTATSGWSKITTATIITWNITFYAQWIANTQTYTCTAKPATGTVWNSVASYTQTWNGSAWSPANTSTLYNTIASSSTCNYKCDTYYTWNGTNCVPWCNAPDIYRNWYYISACNVWSATAGTTSASYWNYYTRYEAQTVCPSWYRTPSISDWRNIIGVEWDVDSATLTAILNNLKLPMAWYKLSGVLNAAGSNARYWTSERKSTISQWRQLNIRRSHIAPANTDWPDRGNPVRCFRN